MKTVTERQKNAVRDIEEYVAFAPPFNGDIDNYNDVSAYLTKYLKFLYNDTWAITRGYD